MEVIDFETCADPISLIGLACLVFGFCPSAPDDILISSSNARDAWDQIGDRKV